MAGEAGTLRPVRVGQGFDAHRLVAGRKLMLGGVEFRTAADSRGTRTATSCCTRSPARCSARWERATSAVTSRRRTRLCAGIASGELLARVRLRVRAAGLRVAHLDSTLVAQEPRLAGFLEPMRGAIAALLETGAERVNVKVTSPDGLGAIGRGEGIAAYAVVLLEGAP